MYPYHNRIKQRIKNGELIGFYCGCSHFYACITFSEPPDCILFYQIIHSYKSDNTIADLITDGCNMGVKSLNKFLNQYKAADEKSKDITKRLINLEEKLAIDIRSYL